jgi:hypothetical protein
MFEITQVGLSKISLPEHGFGAYLPAMQWNLQIAGVKTMLKELNKIAAGLLGLHGYPNEPWTPPAHVAESGRRSTPASGSGRTGKTRNPGSRPRRTGATTRAWR